jgi:pimeloyl-ACP methyl ester carboxylesterase
MATYGAASHEPDRWRRVVAASVPPAAAIASGFFDYDQIKRSFYMFFFQTPLADMAVPMNDLEFVARLWQDWSPGHDGATDIDHVRDALRDPTNLAAAIGYYRAMFDDSTHDPALAAQQAATAAAPPQPTLYLHGRDDGCIGVGLAGQVGALLPAGESEVVIVEGAGHFLQVEKPDEINELVVDFVTAS